MRRMTPAAIVRTTLLTSTALLLLIASFGCEQNQTAEPAPVVHTPLDLDPTHDIEIGEWWTNGRNLMRLYPDGRYAQYATMNRYETPVQRGRWSQGSYAVLWLEPYTTQQQRIRVSIDRVDGEIVLNVPKLGTMHAVNKPPAVLEDQLVGTWENQLGRLRLDRSMRFEYDRKWSGDGAAPVATFPSQGAWRLIDRQLELRPDSPVFETVWMKVEVSADGITLESPHGVFRKPAIGWMTTETDANPG